MRVRRARQCWSWAFRDITNGARIVAVTQAANVESVALLVRLGMIEVDRFEEWGEPQVMMALEPTTQASPLLES